MKEGLEMELYFVIHGGIIKTKLVYPFSSSKYFVTVTTGSGENVVAEIWRLHDNLADAQRCLRQIMTIGEKTIHTNIDFDYLKNSFYEFRRA
jgi:hypothetical protein